MQFLAYDPHYNPEGQTPPTPEMMEEMGKFIGEAMQAGVLVTTGALQPTGTRLRRCQRQIHRDRWAVHRIEGADGGVGSTPGGFARRGH